MHARWHAPHLPLVVLSLAMSANCTKEPTATTTAAGPVEPVLAIPSPQAKAVLPPRERKPDDSSAALLRYLPRDSSVVIGLNWRKARTSEVVRSYDERIAKGIPEIAEIKAVCGRDPVAALHSAALSLGSDPTNNQGMVVALSGDFDRETFDSCVVTLGGAVDGNRYNGVINAYWPSENIIVLSMGISSEELALAPALSAWDNDKLMILVDELDLHASLWFAGLLPVTAASTLASVGMGAAPWGGYGNFDIDSRLQANVGLEFTNRTDAEAAMTMAEMAFQMLKQQPPMATLSDNITPGVVGNALVVAADFSAEQVAQLQTLLKQVGL